MKKVMKIIGIILLIVVGIAVVLFLRKPAVPTNYIEIVETGGDIEAKYLQRGMHEVSSKNISVMENFKSYTIYYPSDISSKCPAIVFANGTGVKASKYPALLEHLASWGFVAIGTEEQYSWNGFSCEMCTRLLIKLNETENISDWDTNPFYGNIDLDNIGVSGHSQGGVGVINTITNTNHADLYKCAFAASPSNMELSHALEWDYDASLVDIPIMLVSGTGSIDENTVVSLSQLQDIYKVIPDSTSKIMARRAGADHSDMLYITDGYMTAWFMWHLQGDQEAEKAFVGDGAEISNNLLYIDLKSNLNE